MMMQKTLIFICAAVFVVLILSGTATAAGAPKDAIESTISSILDVLKDKSLLSADKKQERRDKIRALLRSRFDFPEMSRRSLARHWKKRSAEEKKEFVSIFSDLLESSYIGKIERYTDEKITYDKETIKSGGKYAVVNTTIETKNVDIPIDYKARLKADKWFIYDVIIEGVSFISTYRSQYNKIILKESFAGLIRSMKKKLDEQRTTLK